MTDIKDRKRKIEINNLSDEQADSHGFEMGKKIGKILQDTQTEVNKILSCYTHDGKPLKAELAYTLIDPDTGKPLKL